MSGLNRIAAGLARVVDRLSTRIERQAVPETAAELGSHDLSDGEALALALFAEGRPGTDVESREEKVALAAVIARHAHGPGARRRRVDWRGAIERTCPAYGGERWRVGAAALFERPGLLPPGPERAELARHRRRVQRELAQAVEVARLALAGQLPVNTPGADRFATDSEIAFAKAEGRVTPATLVRYGDHWFYQARADRGASATPRGDAPGRGAVTERSRRRRRSRARTPGSSAPRR